MSTPDFTKIAYKGKSAPVSYEQWKKDLAAKTGKSAEDYVWQTMEQIPVKPLYTSEDYTGMEHLGYTAGIAPFLRGPYATMYVFQPWTVRERLPVEQAKVTNEQLLQYTRNTVTGTCSPASV